MILTFYLAYTLEIIHYSFDFIFYNVRYYLIIHSLFRGKFRENELEGVKVEKIIQFLTLDFRKIFLQPTSHI